MLQAASQNPQRCLKVSKQQSKMKKDPFSSWRKIKKPSIFSLWMSGEQCVSGIPAFCFPKTEV